ncbi:hypothetical protein QD409_11845 [Rhizobium sp. BR 315]|nr:hypothetical protein [Rhizobium miluonense]
MGDTLRRAFADADELRKIGETHGEIVICVIKPIGTAASQRHVIASGVAVLFELDRRHRRLSLECDQGAIEAIDDPPPHLPCAEKEFQLARQFPLLFESRKHFIFLFLYAFRTENRCALFLEML